MLNDFKEIAERESKMKQSFNHRAKTVRANKHPTPPITTTPRAS
jgi:hypothetical protein